MKKRQVMASVSAQKIHSSYDIRRATADDFDAIYTIFHQVLSEGTTYAYTLEQMNREAAREYWMTAAGTHTYVACVDGKVAGCYALRPNRTGRGKHVANASYIVDPDMRKRGVGRALGEHAIICAKEQKYDALQFNFVVSANEAAVKLWRSLGFEVVGTLPKGFDHATKGLVDVYVMHRFL